MLFNSPEFIFGFLPVTLVLFFLLGRHSRTWALRWIIAASLVFYAWWRPLNVLIIAPSIIVNYALARTLARLATRSRPKTSRAVLLVGILFNIAFLGYFKYANFLTGVANDVFGTSWVLAQIVLPLGISFITFQKIAFLIDVHARRVESFTLQDYCLFVLFFPQLIAGPIVHYREMMPQFLRTSCAPDRENLSVGLTLFALGLFKKAVLADGIAPLVSSIYAQASGGHGLTLLPAWMAAVGFTFQIYFDFSGYTDMALGLARFVGVRFPPNFNSPLKASSIIDFWLRWHMTLTRFLTAYIYNPLVLWLTRRRMAKGRPSFGGRHTTPGAFLWLLMMPTLLTMLVSGLWHGAGYLFILWGLLHGLYLAVNHAWRLVGPKLWSSRASYERVMKPVGFVLTFVGVAAAMVLFRSTTTAAAADLLKGMAGMNGVGLPSLFYDRVASHLPGFVHRLSGVEQFGEWIPFKSLAKWLAFLALISFGAPNSLQLLSQYEPALGVKPEWGWRLGRLRLDWSPSLPWSVAMAAVMAVGILQLGGVSEFLYWQF